MDDPKTEDQKPTLPASTPAPAEPIFPIDQWREALLKQPEWPTLPESYHTAILRRLKSTNYPAEPSGHSTWKNVKTSLQRGEQPDWVSLITATFIWRVKRKQRPDSTSPTVTALLLPDTFVAEAAFHNPPVDIATWPTRDGATAAPWAPKTEEPLLPLREVKAEEEGEEGEEEEEEAGGAAGGPGLWAPRVGGRREATVAPGPREGTVAREPEGRPPATSGTTGGKRARTGDEDGAMARPQKRVYARGRAGDGGQGPANAFADWKMKFAAADRNLADANGKIAGMSGELADTNRRLADTGRKLEETTTELGELRAIAMSNRRILRRIVGCLGEATRSQEQMASRMRSELQALEENMG